MFTGIVEEVGTIDTISRGANSAVLTIRAEKVLAGTKVGDSICLLYTSPSPRDRLGDVYKRQCAKRSTCQFGACDGGRWQIRRAHRVGTC